MTVTNMNIFKNNQTKQKDSSFIKAKYKQW